MIDDGFPKMSSCHQKYHRKAQKHQKNRTESDASYELFEKLRRHLGSLRILHEFQYKSTYEELYRKFRYSKMSVPLSRMSRLDLAFMRVSLSRDSIDDDDAFSYQWFALLFFA